VCKSFTFVVVAFRSAPLTLRLQLLLCFEFVAAACFLGGRI
jgi:hypothetical protein